MALADAQRGGFEDRLARIKKGGDNTAGAIQIGPREEVRANASKRLRSKHNNTVRMKKKKSAKKVQAGEGSTSVLIVLGLMFGALSMFVGQAAAFQLFSGQGLLNVTLPEVAAPALPFAHFILGGTLAFLFAWTFRLTTAVRLIAVAVGAYAMVHFHADMVGKMPGLYTNFFTEAYVVEMLAKA